MRPLFTFRLATLIFSLILTAQLGYGQITEDFITTWEVTEDNLTVKISRWTELEYNYSIDWGDGTKQSSQTGSPEHTYSSAGTYTVKVSGFTFPGFRLTNDATRQIRTVEQWGNNRWETFEDAFKSCQSLVINATDAPNLGRVSLMDDMFNGASNLTGDFSGWNTQQVTSMENMFKDAASFTSDLSNWDVSNVTNMREMFSDAASFNSDLSDWDVSSVTDMSFMFDGATAFNSDLNDWNVSKVTDMEFMFQAASSFNSDLDKWNVSNVTQANNMFQEATAFNGKMTGWDLSKVSDLTHMFYIATAFNGDVSGWKVQNVTDMSQMFREATAFNQPMNDWDVSAVTDMSSMFYSANSFNQDLDNWETGNVTAMNEMFYEATAFNGNIGTWDVSKVSNIRQMFLNAKAFNSDISAWDVGNANSLASMFSGASAFNADISNWDVSGLIEINNMFQNATAFNQPIGKWDIQLAPSSSSIFGNATAFDQDLGNWNVESASRMTNLFSGSGMSVQNYNATLFGWSQQSLKSDVSIGVDGLEYCNIGELSRQKLIADFNWTFSGDTEIQCPPTLFSGVKDSDTQLTVTFDVAVQTNGGNPTDFTVTDAFGTDYPVAAQADGSAGDSEVVLTVADLSAAIGDLTVSYTNNNSEIKDTTPNELEAGDSDTEVDTDAEAPTLVSAVRNSDTQITLTFNEPVQTKEGGLFAFTVTDDGDNTFEVTAQVDGTTRDNQIVLTVADLSSAVGLLTFNYSNNAQVSDFGGNVLEDASALVCADGFSCNLIVKTLCVEESYTLNSGQVVINPEQLVQVDTVGTVITQYRFTVDESVDCCPDGFTCDVIDVNSCTFPYTSPLGNTTSVEGRVIDMDNANLIRNVYNVTFDRAEPIVDIYQNATIAEAGSVTYQANTNATGVLSFDKTQDQWVNLNALQDDLNGSSRSIFMWVKSETNVASTHQTLFAINTASGGNVSLLWIDDDSDNLEVNDGSNNQSASFNMGGDEWHYVGYTYDVTTNETVVYVNGIENDRYTNNQITANDSQYSLGQEFDNSSTGNFYNGEMAEVSVWNEVLTPAEIRVAMKAKITNEHTAYDHLVGYYSIFGECTDDVNLLKDHSGNGNDGTFQNGLAQDFQNLQSIEGFNAIGWYDHFSWQKDGVEVSTASEFTTDVEVGNYKFTASRSFVQSTDTWSMALNSNATTVDNIADEVLCEDDPITRNVTANAVNYLDFEEEQDNYVQINALTDDVAGKSRSVFMWYNKESSIGSGGFDEILVFQDADVDQLSRFYIRDTERLALWDGVNTRLNSSALSNDTWYFIGYTYDNATGEAKLYLNGNEEDSGTLNMPLGDGWMATLGAKFNDNGPEDFTDGKLAEITIWDKVLTPEEITSLMAAAPANDATNLVASYGTLPGIADNTLRDLTTNGNDGLISHPETMVITTEEVELTDYDATTNYLFSWKKGETEFDTDANGNITIDEGTTNYSVTYGTPLFQKTDEFSLSYTNLLPTQPFDQTEGVTSSVTFEVDEIAGASYQWYEVPQEWRTTTGNENGFGSSSDVNSVYAKGDVVYAGTSSGGLSISSDGGVNWTTTTFGQNGFAVSNSIRSIYAGSNKVYVGTGGGISISSDGGLNWTTTTMGQNGFAGSNILLSVYAEGDIVYAGTGNGLSISSDGGSNWTTITTGVNGYNNTNTVQAVYAQGSTIYVGTENALSISEDGASSWRSIFSSTDGFASVSNVNSVFAQGNIIYVGTVSGLSISIDGGANWTTTAPRENGFANSTTVNSVYAEGDVIYVGTDDGLSISTDGGENWTTTTSGQNSFPSSRSVNSVYADDGIVYAGTSGGVSTLAKRIRLSDNSDTNADNQIQGATTHQLTINNLTLDKNGTEYFVEVTKDGCTQSSDDVTLTVLDVPVATAFTPANGSTDIAIDAGLSMEFSKTVTAGTGELKIFNYATDALVQTITADALTISGSTVSITSGISLDYATQYYITLDADLVKDADNAGNLAYSDKDTWSFHTVCGALILTEPEDQARLVAGSATFSVPEVAGASYQWYRKEASVTTVDPDADINLSQGYIAIAHADGGNYYVAGGNRQAFFTKDGGATWESLTNNRSGTAIYADGDQIYQSGTDGIAVSYNGGETFQEIKYDENGLSGGPGGIWEYVYGAGDDVYIADGDLYVSVDRGENFEEKTIIADGVSAATDFVRVYDGKLYLATNNGLYISSDKGGTFTRKTTDDGLTSNRVRNILKYGNVLYLVTYFVGSDDYSVLEVSTDNGNSFTSIPQSTIGNAGIKDIAVDADGRLYVATLDGVRVSSDNGQSFDLLTIGGLSENDNVSKVDIDENNTFYVVTDSGLKIISDRVALTNNSDDIAANQIQGADTNELTINNLSEVLDQTEYFVVVTKGICEETSGTVTLSVTCEPLVLAQPMDQTVLLGNNATFSIPEVSGSGYEWFARTGSWQSFIAGSNGFPSSKVNAAAFSDNYFYAATSNGLAVLKGTWEVLNESSTLSSNNAKSVAIDGQLIVVGYDGLGGGVSISTDGGVNWQSYNAANGLAHSVRSVTIDAGKIYVASNSSAGGGLYVSSNQGTNWEYYSNASDINNSPNDVFANGDNIYVAGNGGLSLSTDGGSSWTGISEFGNGLSNSINAIAVENGKIYLGAINNGSLSGGLFVSEDNGVTWQSNTTEEGLVSNAVSDVFVAEDEIFVATSQGLSTSVNGGASWINDTTDTGLPSNIINGVYHFGPYLLLGTSDAGLVVGAAPISLIEASAGDSESAYTGADTHELIVSNVTEGLDQTEFFVSVSKGECKETSNTAILSIVSGPPTSAPFILAVTTTGANEEFTIPVQSGLTYSYSIDWGDGTVETNQTGAKSHTYANAGTYEVKIGGTFPAINFGQDGTGTSEDDIRTNAEKVKDILAWGDIAWSTMNHAFAYTGLTTLSATDQPDLGQVTDLGNMFYSARLFNSDLSAWDVSNVTNMEGMFDRAKAFNGNISTWNVGNVTNMDLLFNAADAFNGDIANWNTANVTSMVELFDGAESFNGDISDWEVGKVTNMSEMFSDATAFNGDLSSWDVSSVTNMFGMFEEATSFNGDISNWNVGNVATMEEMFYLATAFNQNLQGWDVSKVINMNSMFKEATAFNGNLSGWRMSSATTMEEMFQDAESFNQDISAWDVGNVTTMEAMFNGALAFNQDISLWNVSSVTTMDEMFSGAEAFNQDISAWDVSNATSMEAMFVDAVKFDQDLGGWDIRNAAQANGLVNLFEASGLTMANYDATLIGWSALTGLASGVSLGSVPTTFCTSETQRQMLIDNLSWSFDDEGKANNCFAAPDAVTLDSFVPANGATGVSVTSNIVLTFSENVQAYVYGEGGTAVNDVVLYNATDNEVERFPANTLAYSAGTVTIDPTADLDYSQTYYLLIDAEAFIANTDAKFAGVSDVNAIRFTTEAKPNTAPVASVQDFTGNLEVNQQLTGSYTYTDADTDAESGTTFQWYVADDAAGANSTAISGATAQNYALTASEEGKFVSLAITPNDGTDAGTEVFTAYKGVVVPAVIPTLISTVPVDEAKDIVASNDLSFVLSEAVTKGTGNITFTPAVGSATVIDVTSAEVTLSGTNVTVNPTADLLEGQFYTVTFDAAAFVDSDGNNSAGLTSQTVWNFTTKEAQVAPVASAVGIKKSIIVDGTLEGSYSYSDGNDDPESGSTYQWYRADDAVGSNKAAISGAIAQDYVAQAADNNKYVSFEVTPNDGNLAGTAVESNFFGPVLVNDGFTNIPPAFTSDPITTILDNVNYSYTITTEDLNSHVVSLIKTTGPAWLSLSGGVLNGDPSGQVGDHVVVLTADDGNGGTKTQEFTITVEASNTAPSVNGIEVTGTTTIDQVLTGTYNFIDAENDADNSGYQWYRADDNAGTNKAAIAGATTTTYTLTSADAGKFISFEVTPNDSKIDGTLAESTVVGAVAKKVPTLSLSAITKVYGDANFDLSATTNSTGAITYSFDNDQTSANLTGATVTLGNVGTITVNVSLAADAEYEARQVKGKITVAKRAIEVTATNASKGVGATDPTLAFTVSSGAIVGSDEVVSITRDAGEAVGTYAMTFTEGADAANYNISRILGLFTINPVAITVTADAAIKTYGEADPQFTYTITSGALNTGDELMGGITREQGEKVGVYGLKNSLFNPDYDIAFVSANLTVSKAVLTATADDQTRFLGDANPELTISYTGFVNGDKASDITAPTAATIADANSPLGTYEITLSGGAANNYNLSLVNGTLTVAQRQFITTWEITSNDVNRVRTFFNAVAGLTYLYDIDWGDGTVETNQSRAAAHTYTTAGTYTVKISGQFPQIQMSFSRLLSVEQWGDIEWKSMESAFVGSSFSINATDAPDLSQATSMKGMFGRANIGAADLSGWDVSTITDMSEMFKESNFSGSISSWDLSAVTDMNFMFAQTTNFNSDITGWNTSGVQDMSYLFYFANAFNQAIGSWNVGNVTDMSNMFADAAAFNQDLNNWDVSKVTTMEKMFDNAGLFNGNITGWNVSSVTDMSNMFDDAKAFNQNIGGWNVSNVTEMNAMFNDADAFNHDLNSWNTSKVTTFEAMFQNNDAFNGAIGNWDISGATRIARMFEDAHAFNQDISNWQPTNAENLTGMFRDARAFNQDISSWRFPKADRLNQMFYEAAVFNQDISTWETGNIVDMSSMFENAEAFNQDISGWDVSSVRSFGSMFRGTLAFNQNIGEWNMSATTSMNSMFKNAAAFNQDISRWTFAADLSSMSGVFENATAFDQDLSSWDISNITSLSAIFSNSGMSLASYDATLIGWATQGVKSDVQFGVEGLKYCAGTAARQSLIDDHNWTIENDSQSCTATVTIADASGNEDNGNITVTLTSDAFVVGGFTVDVSTADGTAIAGTDYTAVASQTITFAGAAGETQTFTISPTADTSVEGNETLTVNMSNLVTGANNTVTITDQATVTIVGDDQPVVSFVATAAANTESTASQAIEVTLNQVGLTAASVDYAVTGTATGGGTDHTLAAGTLNFTAGDVSETISLSITNDQRVEADETVVITLSNASGASIGTNASFTYTIEDDDQATVSLTGISTNEGAGTATLTATLDKAVDRGFTVALVTAESSAIKGVDYTGLEDVTLTFAGTVGETQTTTISLIDDTIVEFEESISVLFGNLGGTSLNVTTGDVVEVKITDNDEATVTIADVTQSEDGESFLITATLDKAVSGGFKVDVSTNDGTATIADGDYTALTGQTLTFTGTAGETQTFEISPVADGKLETNETFTVTMSNLAATTLPVTITDRATMTIANDDAAAVTIAGASGNEGDGAITLTARLDNAVQGGFTVDVSTADGTATIADGDYTAINGQTLTFAGTAGEEQIFTVIPNNDLKIENDETLTVSMSGLSTVLPVNISDGATVTLINDDFNNFPTDISLSAASIAENNALDATIGSLTTTDADAGNTHSYSLIAGTGDADNATFSIDGANLKVNNTSFNFEDKASYSVRIQTDDGEGGTFAKAFTVTVTNVNESPFTLSLTNSTIDESDDAQDVGIFMALDPDAGDTFTYTLVAGSGDADNAEFATNGSTLRTAGAIDFEDGDTRSIRIRVTDTGGLTFEQAFTITIEDVVAEPVRDYTTNVPGGNVKNVFSPNGDGVNETWVIEDLTDNPFNEVKVFAQGGKLIYNKVNYTNDWAGTFRDDPVPDGTYYYEILIFENAQSTTPARVIKGFLTIIRNR